MKYKAGDWVVTLHRTVPVDYANHICQVVTFSHSIPIVSCSKFTHLMFETEIRKATDAEILLAKLGLEELSTE